MARKRNKQVAKGERFFDWSLFFVIIFIACFGLVMIYSASYYEAQLELGNGAYYCIHQAKILALGVLVMMFVAILPYKFYTGFYLLGWVTALILMILTDFTPFGIVRNNAKRWFGYGDTAFFQTSELVKIVIIVVMAVMITSWYEMMDTKLAVITTCIFVLPLFVLVAKENLSAGIIIFGIAFGMYFVSCRKNRKFWVMTGLAAVGIPLGIMSMDKLMEIGLLKKYQVLRILVWQDPQAYSQDGGFQVLQGLYAIGSGGIFGKGLGNSIQKLSFLPESQNDMIFSVICEELGLFGAVCVLLLYAFLIYRLLVIAQNAPDMLGSMLVIGVMAHISIQVILNVAVVTKLIPNTGISLPLISYGGTSLVFLMAELGMCLGVSWRIRLD